MKKKKSFICIGIVALLILLATIYINGKPVQTSLSVCETQWSELGSTTSDPVVYNPIKRGDVVFDSQSTKVTVASVTEETIVLMINGHMIKPNDDGTINMNSSIIPIKFIKLTKGESIELVSQTMSSGFYLQFSYE